MFFKMAVVSRLEFGERGGHYSFVKFGWNRCSSFDNMQVLIFCEFGLKMAVDRLGQF